MSDEQQSGDQPALRELERESRRLTRLRIVAERTNAEHPDDRTDEHDPDPQQAA